MPPRPRAAAHHQPVDTACCLPFSSVTGAFSAPLTLENAKKHPIYEPVKLGGRFSMKAFMPSFASFERVTIAA